MNFFVRKFLKVFKILVNFLVPIFYFIQEHQESQIYYSQYDFYVFIAFSFLQLLTFIALHCREITLNYEPLTKKRSKETYTFKTYCLNNRKVVILYCNDCSLYLPKTSSHCSICNQCFIEYNFHTYFIDLCICKNNEKFFLYYLTTLMSNCSLMMILIFIEYSTKAHFTLDSLHIVTFTIALITVTYAIVNILTLLYLYGMNTTYQQSISNPFDKRISIFSKKFFKNILKNLTQKYDFK